MEPSEVEGPPPEVHGSAGVRGSGVDGAEGRVDEEAQHGVGSPRSGTAPGSELPLGPVAGEPPAPIPTAPSPTGDSFLPLHWREPPAAASGEPDARPEPTSVSSTARVTVPASALSVWGAAGPGRGVAGSGHSGRQASPWVWVVAVLAASLVGALIGGGIVVASEHGGGTTTVKEISAGPALLNGTTNVETVIDKVLPSVVSIRAKSPEPLSDSAFGSSPGGVQEDQGTGMIISSNGEVVTNNHVISGATTITVTLYGSLKALPATLIETDPADDVALLQIQNESNLPTVTYGDSDNVQVGDALVAIGNALGLSAGTPTVTQGIVSAKGRTVQASDSSGDSTETLTNMIQTDAAINPGNSGGPLVDSSGMVIGMNTAVASSADGTSQAQDIGFAIPSNKITQLLPELRSRSIGNASPRGTGYLGVEIETLTSSIRGAYNFVPTHGAVVLQVESGSPAESAGLQEGDVVVSLDGRSITSADQLGTAIQKDKPGQTVTIGLFRAQKRLTVMAMLSSNSQEEQLGGG
jgi:S1-C subfamily serine protease